VIRLFALAGIAVTVDSFYVMRPEKNHKHLKAKAVGSLSVTNNELKWPATEGENPLRACQQVWL
jgi:hypothetical protein